MNEKWNLIVDVARCDNCRNCFLATKDEHIGNDFPVMRPPNPRKNIVGSTFSARSGEATRLSKRISCR